MAMWTPMKLSRMVKPNRRANLLKRNLDILWSVYFLTAHKARVIAIISYKNKGVCHLGDALAGC